MHPTNYWLMARECSIWNAVVAALQLWTAHLEAHMLGSTIEQVYNTLFYSTSTHLLHQQPDGELFSCFVTTQNSTFESNLALKDRGYESGSKNFNIPTPLRATSKTQHISSVEYASFDPHPVTPHSTSTRESHCRPVCTCLTLNSSEDDDDTTTNEIPSPNSATPVQYHIDTLQQPSSQYAALDTEEVKEEENFQTVLLNDEHWDLEEIPNRHLCIHEHSLPHGLCPYPCPCSDYQTSLYYDTLDLSDISEFEDLMTTSSDEDISALDDIGYLKRL